jgi:hypothetical protein
MDRTKKEFTAQISIIATYDDVIRIEVYDKNAVITFLEMEMTREQFINAVMNRLGNTDVEHAWIRRPDLIGKFRETKPMEFPIPENTPRYGDGANEIACKTVTNLCPDGWEPQMYFGSKGSFFERDGKPWARTTICRWNDEP